MPLKTPDRQELLAVFRYVWKDLKVKQKEISRETGLDQGSISKLLRGHFRDIDGRAYRLWKYAKRRAKRAGYKRGEHLEDPRLTTKIYRVWDRTEEGAVALLKLLDAAELIQKRRARVAAKRKAV